MQKEDFAFLDFEASSLSGGGWPIEVGISTLHEDVNRIRVGTWSSLIYGLTFQDLEQAPDAEHVAHEVLKRLTKKIVVCDAPDFDGRWLRKLLMSTGSCPVLRDFGKNTGSASRGS